MRPLNRGERNLLPAAAYTTYQIAAPLPTHWRRATCAEVDCGAYLRGWRTTLDAADPLVLYIRAESGRQFRESRNELGQVVFDFPAGQMCFRAAEHREPLEREPVFLRRGGDYRGNPLGEVYQHTRAEDWVDDCATHQDRLATRLGHG